MYLHVYSQLSCYRGTVVENYQNFWINVKSGVITSSFPLESSSPASTSNTPGSSPDVVNHASIPVGFSNDDLKKAMSETFESIDGPLESVDEVLLHQ